MVRAKVGNYLMARCQIETNHYFYRFKICILFFILLFQNYRDIHLLFVQWILKYIGTFLRHWGLVKWSSFCRRHIHVLVIHFTFHWSFPVVNCNNPTSIQILAWRQTGVKPLSETMIALFSFFLLSFYRPATVVILTIVLILAPYYYWYLTLSQAD